MRTDGSVTKGTGERPTIVSSGVSPPRCFSLKEAKRLVDLERHPAEERSTLRWQGVDRMASLCERSRHRKQLRARRPWLLVALRGDSRRSVRIRGAAGLSGVIARVHPPGMQGAALTIARSVIAPRLTTARPDMDVALLLEDGTRSPASSRHTILVVMRSEVSCPVPPRRERRARGTRRAGVHLGGVLLLVSSLLLVDTHALSGQEPGAPRPDQRVRLRAPSLGPHPLSGRIAGVSTDSAWIRLEEGEAPQESRWIVPGTRLRRFEQSPGQRSHGLRGLLIGIPAGALTATLVWNAAKEADDEAVLNAYAAAGGGVAGGLVGLGIGSLIRSEAWQLAPSAWVRSRTFVVGVSVSKRH